MNRYKLITRDQNESYIAICRALQGIYKTHSDAPTVPGEIPKRMLDFRASGHALTDKGIRFSRPPGKWPCSEVFVGLERLQEIYCDGKLIWKRNEQEQLRQQNAALLETLEALYISNAGVERCDCFDPFTGQSEGTCCWCKARAAIALAQPKEATDEERHL